MYHFLTIMYSKSSALKYYLFLLERHNFYRKPKEFLNVHALEGQVKAAHFSCVI